MIWLWLYLAGMAVFLVPTARFILTTVDDDDPVMAVVLAFCAVPFWPLFLPGYLAYRALKPEEKA